MQREKRYPSRTGETNHNNILSQAKDYAASKQYTLCSNITGLDELKG